MHKPWLSNAYREHLASDAWAIIRDAALARAGHKCSRCPTTAGLQVHHLTYVRLGHELPDDVSVLCTRCHDGEHHRQDWNRRVNAVARSRYGDDYAIDDYQHEQISDWLQRQDDQ